MDEEGIPGNGLVTVEFADERSHLRRFNQAANRHLSQNSYLKPSDSSL